MRYFKKKSQDNVKLEQLYQRLSKLTDKELDKIDSLLNLILLNDSSKCKKVSQNNIVELNEQSLDDVILAIKNQSKSEQLSKRLDQFKQLKSGKKS